MSKSPELIADAERSNPLRMYRTPWQGEVLFACKKCQRRIKKHHGEAALVRLKKWFKKRSRSGAPVRVIDIPCVKLCPKGGVTVFSRHQLAHQPPGVCIARTEADLETLYCELTEVALFPEKVTVK
jgi:hypothetical protein